MRLNLSHLLVPLYLVCTGLHLSCSPKIQTQYSKTVECVSFDQGESQVVSVWCGGKKNYTFCNEAASRAVQQVVFQGISTGQQGCLVSPLVLNPNFRMDYREYLDSFFAPNGKVIQFYAVEERGGPLIRCQDQPHKLILRVYHKKLIQEFKSQNLKAN